MSSSDDDAPLTARVPQAADQQQQKQQKQQPEAKTEPKAEPKPEPAAADDSSDDDEVPLAQMRQKVKQGEPEGAAGATACRRRSPPSRRRRRLRLLVLAGRQVPPARFSTHLPPAPAPADPKSEKKATPAGGKKAAVKKVGGLIGARVGWRLRALALVGACGRCAWLHQPLIFMA